MYRAPNWQLIHGTLQASCYTFQGDEIQFPPFHFQNMKEDTNLIFWGVLFYFLSLLVLADLCSNLQVLLGSHVNSNY